MKIQTTSFFRYFFLGLQHVLTMNIYVAPLILASLLASNAEQTATLIQMTFIASGIATLIQVGFGIQLPVMQGPSFVPLGALAIVGKKYGIPVMIGSMIPGALAITLLGQPFQILGKFMKTWITPLVGGSITLVIGVSLIPLALQTIGTLPGNATTNFGVAGLTCSLLTFLAHLKLPSARWQGLLQSSSVILALLLGTGLMSLWSTAEKSSTPEVVAWFSVPQWMPFGTPQFQLEPLILISLVYGVILVETIGTWYVVGTVIEHPIDEKLINRGGLGEGLGCLIAALFGSTPVTGYAANAGILSITKNHSRWVAVAVGLQLLAIGLIPKFIHFLASIPTQAMLGVFLAACGVIAYNGYLLIQKFGWTLRNQVIAGTPVLLSILISLIPQSWVQSHPASISPFFSSGISVGALTAIALNRIWPERQ